MNLLAQHAYGKTAKIEQGLSDGCIAGAILNPRYEIKGKMTKFIRKVHDDHPNAELMIDPHFFYSTLGDVKEGYLPDYPYYRSGLQWSDFLDPSTIAHVVTECLKYQNNLPLKYIISPSILFEGLRDRWAQTALQMGQQAIKLMRQKRYKTPVLISIVCNDSLFSSEDDINELLDIITLWDTAGFYIVVERTKSPSAHSIANLMYFIHVLSNLNNYEVFCGYTDILGLAYATAGATGTASGWSNTSKQFSIKNIEKGKKGGQAPKKRVFAEGLLCSLKLIGELDGIRELKKLSGIIPKELRSELITASGINDAKWSRDRECLQAWKSLGTIGQEISKQKSGVDRIRVLQSKLDKAVKRIRSLTTDGAISQSKRLKLLNEMSGALDLFRKRI